MADLTDREVHLMQLAFDIAREGMPGVMGRDWMGDYATLDHWLDYPVTDGGHLISMLIARDAPTDETNRRLCRFLDDAQRSIEEKDEQLKTATNDAYDTAKREYMNELHEAESVAGALDARVDRLNDKNARLTAELDLMREYCSKFVVMLGIIESGVTKMQAGAKAMAKEGGTGSTDAIEGC